MSFADLIGRLSELLDRPLFTMGNTETTVGSLLVVTAIIGVTLWASRTLGKAVHVAFEKVGLASEGTVDFYARVVRTIVVTSGLGVGLHNLGIDLTALMAAGGLIAVAIGFAMKNVAENFVSGVILSFERAIQVGDVLEVEGAMVKVRRLGIRSTIARGREDEDLVIPNSILVQSTVRNFTLRDDSFRMRSPVGVAYGSDMKLVMETLRVAAERVGWRDLEKEPRIMLLGFGSSSVDFEVSVWVQDPWENYPRRSDLNKAIWWALKEKGITIAYPQLDVHFDRPVESPMEGLRGVGQPGR